MELEKSNCNLCPRKCNICRENSTGFCGVFNTIRLASVVLHKGEEPPISGTKGSGTFFFSGCTLGCSFCQNCQISRGQMGKDISTEYFSQLLLEVQNRGAHNVNFVTGTQFVPQIINGLNIAKARGFSLPVVWNSSGYETPETLKILDNHVQIFLPDCKTVNSSIANQVLNSKDYAEVIRKALPLMIKEIKIVDDIMIQGTIIRHLVLPGLLNNTKEVLKYFSENFKERAFLSVMVQYSPPEENDLCSSLPNEMKDKNYRITESEYDQIFQWFEEFGIEEGFIQDLEQERFWLPDFIKYNPFPEKYSEVIWSHNIK